MMYENIYNEMKVLRDEDAAIKMKAYMRDKFEFLGVKTPERKKACKGFYNNVKKDNYVDWEFVNSCWENKYREMQYVAVGYLAIKQNLLNPLDVDKLKRLAQTKSWWDTIDGLDRIVGNIALSYPEVNNTLLKWSVDEDFWLRRIAIDHQLTRKDKTNTELLEEIIKNNFGQKEFFINKAIGWSLREYSKTNPNWVRNFIEKHKDKMASLSIKEASKYI